MNYRRLFLVLLLSLIAYLIFMSIGHSVFISLPRHMDYGCQLAIALPLSALVSLSILALLSYVCFKQNILASYSLQRFPISLLFDWLIVIIGLSSILSVFAYELPVPQLYQYEKMLMSSGQGNGLLLFVALGVAPFFEECLFRGFLFQGVKSAGGSPKAAIVLSSLLWTLTHFQYYSIVIVPVFGFGLLLAYARQQSGSTWLSIILHGVLNGVQVATYCFMASFVHSSL